MPKQLSNTFWDWYEKHLQVNTAIASFLFAIQLFHLYWLTTHVVTDRLFGLDLFNPTGFIYWVIVLADYIEIPALITTSLVYINEIRKKGINRKDLFLLFSINSQWLHLFWITDEFVVDQFTGKITETVLPFWLAWVSIGIDYLELPVIYDTLKKTFKLFFKD